MVCSWVRMQYKAYVCRYLKNFRECHVDYSINKCKTWSERFMNIIISSLLNIVKALDYLIPKKSNSIVFYSYPDYSDNCRAMYEELVRQGRDKDYHITWVVRNVKKYRRERNNIRFVKHRSFGSLWAFCRARYIIRTHSYWGNKYVPGRQIMVVAWHGMLLKGYHYSEMGTHPHNGHDHFCVTSPLFQTLYSEMMNTDTERFDITGLPRNDYLFQPAPDLKKKMNVDEYSRVIIWMPTFRRYGDGQMDGISSRYGLPTLEEGDLEAINDEFSKRNYMLLIKLHPWAKESVGEIVYSHVREVTLEDIPEPYTLYHLLAQTDALISDYSSVYGDYLLLDKPIGFAFDDLKEYSKSRYIPLSPLTDYMPGMKIYNRQDLIGFVDSLDKDDQYKEERKKVRDLFFVDEDGNSSERFLRSIGIL